MERCFATTTKARQRYFSSIGVFRALRGCAFTTQIRYASSSPLCFLLIDPHGRLHSSRFETEAPGGPLAAARYGVALRDPGDRSADPPGPAPAGDFFALHRHGRHHLHHSGGSRTEETPS